MKKKKKITRTKNKEPKASDKRFGVCECCEQKTVLVALVGLCGPCCFGEAETINGNW